MATTAERAGAARRRPAGRGEARALAIEALRSDRPLAEVAAEHNLTAPALRRLIRRELEARLPRIAGSLAGAVGCPVEIVRDRYGIPHVFGESEADLYVGLGFAVAQDRLWQLEYRRRWAYGTLAELLGSSALASDRTARTLRFDRIAVAEHAKHPAETRRLLDSYAAGINAAIAAFGDDLPIELDLLGIRPAPWRAVDTVTIARASLWQFSGRIETIVVGEAAGRLLPPDLAARFLSVEAPEESIVPPGDQMRAAPSASRVGPVGSAGRSGTAAFSDRAGTTTSPDGAGLPASSDRAASVAESTSRRAPTPGPDGTSSGRQPSPDVSKRGAGEPQGSNQWAVGPGLSASGAPLLASDGHVPYYQPSTRYEVHLAGDGLDVIGIMDVGVPLVTNGRTRGVAWGLTNNVSSVRDLYAEEPSPADPDVVRDGAGWARLDAREETIRVRGAEPTRLMVQTGPRGPIVNHLIPSVDPNGDPPLALRWVGLDPRDCISGGLELARTRTCEEVRATHRAWQFSGQNPGFADTAGQIGYQMRIRFPVRDRITRGYRSPSSPEDAWQDPLPFERLPAEADPERGWIGSANQRLHPPDSDLPLYGAYGDGYRGRRIGALLDGEDGRTGPFSIDDMGRMQNDVYSERAAALKDVVAALLVDRSGAGGAAVRRDRTGATAGRGDGAGNAGAGADESAGGDLIRAARILRRWDCRFTVGSVGASLFAAFWGRWCERVVAARFPAHLLGPMTGAVGAIAHDLLAEGDLGWFEGTTIGAEVRAALADAVGWLGERLGPDWPRWTWGRLHPLTLTHALSAGRPVFAALFDLGPRPCPGGTGVLNQNGYVVRDRFRVTSGPHYRFLADLAEPARALGTNTAGNSGNPASPHYADQFADWLAGRYHPLWMDRAEIDAHAETTLRLMPAT